MVIGPHFERPRARHGPTRIPEHLPLLGDEQRMATCRQGAHHRYARILVGLEQRQGIDDEEDFHGS